MEAQEVGPLGVIVVVQAVDLVEVMEVDQVEALVVDHLEATVEVPVGDMEVDQMEAVGVLEEAMEVALEEEDPAL